MIYSVTPIPSGYSPQTVDLQELRSIAKLTPSGIVAHFRGNADAAHRVLNQSYDKRYTPSTFIEEIEGGYQVGWYDKSREHVQVFTDFSEAVSDYILFSFGMGRLSRQDA